MRTGETRLCDPKVLRILSAQEDRAIRAHPEAYIARQREVDQSQLFRKQKAWNALLNHPKAMEKRNATMAVVASPGL
jgi:hypothetical protein